MNLCINVVHAMPEGGELEISLSRDREQHVILEISDTGSGLEKNTLEKYLTRFLPLKRMEKVLAWGFS